MKLIGLTYSIVAAAAESLEQRGCEISVRALQKQLGGGSPAKIMPLLRQWQIHTANDNLAPDEGSEE